MINRPVCWIFWNLLLFALMLSLGSSSFAKDEKIVLSIVDRVQFTVPSNWKVIASKSDANQTVFAFQIANPADEGTPDSTNLGIVASNFKNEEERSEFKKKSLDRSNGAVSKELLASWTCSSFSAKQRSTSYVIWDCYEIVADCGIHVRLAWPHLPKNSPDYDQSMEMVLQDLLKSVAPYHVPTETTPSPRG